MTTDEWMRPVGPVEWLGKNRIPEHLGCDSNFLKTENEKMAENCLARTPTESLGSFRFNIKSTSPLAVITKSVFPQCEPLISTFNGSSAAREGTFLIMERSTVISKKPDSIAPNRASVCEICLTTGGLLVFI